jgi:hypothetical protein
VQVFLNFKQTLANVHGTNVLIIDEPLCPAWSTNYSLNKESTSGRDIDRGAILYRSVH